MSSADECHLIQPAVLTYLKFSVNNVVDLMGSHHLPMRLMTSTKPAWRKSRHCKPCCCMHHASPERHVPLHRLLLLAGPPIHDEYVVETGVALH
eukprot:6184724-Pleurochrysis_carterae.AAC.1